LPRLSWGVALVQLICYSLDKVFLRRQWTSIDLLRLTLWRTVSPTVAILLLASGFNAFYERRLVGIVWLVIAAIAAMVGMLRLRSAEGMKLQEVKGGELYKRAFVLAKMTKTPLKRVYIVLAGRGHLTNAYGGSHTIAVTDNYGKFLVVGYFEMRMNRSPNLTPDQIARFCASHRKCRKTALSIAGYIGTRESGRRTSLRTHGLGR
jgi:hypothetical protein